MIPAGMASKLLPWGTNMHCGLPCSKCLSKMEPDIERTWHSSVEYTVMAAALHPCGLSSAMMLYTFQDLEAECLAVLSEVDKGKCCTHLAGS